MVSHVDVLMFIRKAKSAWFRATSSNGLTNTTVHFGKLLSSVYILCEWVPLWYHCIHATAALPITAPEYRSRCYASRGSVSFCICRYFVSCKTISALAE